MKCPLYHLCKKNFVYTRTVACNGKDAVTLTELKLFAHGDKFKNFRKDY